MRFLDRRDAGRLLATRLAALKEEHPVVLGLTRGGMPVAFEVARQLAAPLDLVVVRRIPAGSGAEPVVGAIAEGGATYLNTTVMHEAAISRERAMALAEEEIAELARRVRLYRGGLPAVRLDGRAVVVVDDFVSSGTTARAAARAARQRGAARVLLAVPAIEEGVEAGLGADFDLVVALEVISPPHAPSEAYERLEEITDEAAAAYLRRARVERALEEVEPAAIS